MIKNKTADNKKYNEFMNWDNLLLLLRQSSFGQVKNIGGIRGSSPADSEGLVGSSPANLNGIQSAESVNAGDEGLAGDYQRILLSASFRRLQDKTQVFPLDSSDFVRTRLTHSLEVSSLAKRLGEMVGRLLGDMADQFVTPTSSQKAIISDLLLCAGLIHDIGNPPFGHYGETTIRLWFRQHLPKLTFKGCPLISVLSAAMREDLYNFDGNAQGLRVLTKLHFSAEGWGLNLPFSLLHILMKYPVSSLEVNSAAADITRHKLGYFMAEKDIFSKLINNLGTGIKVGRGVNLAESEAASDNQLTFLANMAIPRACRHPLTFLLEAADDIAYRTADIEDAFKKNKFNFDLLYKELRNFNSKNKYGYSEEQCDGYTELVKRLQMERRLASARKLPESDLYALQKWLDFLRDVLAKTVAKNFVVNYMAIMSGQWQSELSTGTIADPVLSALGAIAYKYVFHSRQIIKLELAANSIIGGLLDLFVPACVNFDTEEALDPVQKRLIDIISDNYIQCYRRCSRGRPESEKLYLRLLLVTDYISGMTDGYAKNLLNQLRG